MQQLSGGEVQGKPVEQAAVPTDTLQVFGIKH
jgi:hypothetical protein